MPKKHSRRIPKYCLHKASGQAVVRLNGRDLYLGKYDTPKSRQEYDRQISRWLERGRVQDPKSIEDGVSMAELCLAVWSWAQNHYQDPDGTPSRTLERIRYTIRLLREYYGELRAKDFGPTTLRSFQQKLVDRDYSRRYVNHLTNTTRLIFKQGVAMELINESVWRALTAVDNLKKGRTIAREPEPVLPVDDETFHKTLPWLNPVIRDMVQVQRHCGCRPGELVIMRPCDIDQEKEIWLYIPERHKTQYRNKARVIPLGPKAQEILRKYLNREPESYLFTPEESEAARHREMRKNRKTKVQPSQRNRKKAKRKRPFKPHFETSSYNKAVHYGIRKAAKNGETIEKWSVNQLRHAAATAIRKEFGLEASQVVLGHATADVTQIYAERDLQKAIEVAEKLG